MKKFNRLLSLLLVVVMLAGLMMFTASAAVQYTITLHAQVKDDAGTYIGNVPVTFSLTANEDEKTPVSGSTGSDGGAAFANFYPGVGAEGNEVTLTGIMAVVQAADVPAGYVKKSYAVGLDDLVVNGNKDVNLPAITLEREKYTVKYYANDGTDSQSASTWTYGAENTLKNSSTFTREGYTFLGWATSDDATAKEYDGSAKIVFNDTHDLYATAVNKVIELYAVWAKNASVITTGGVAYKVEHYLERLDGTYAIDNSATETKFAEVKFENGEVVDAPTVYATAKSFDHYSENTTHASRLASSVIFKPSEVEGELNILTLKLYYDLDEYTVEFYGNGGEDADGKDKSTSIVKYGETKKTKGDIFTREGYTFLGWATNDAATAKEYDAAESFTLVDGNPLYAKAEGKVIKLYAVWAKNASVVTPVAAAYKVEHYIQKPDGTYELKETEFPLYGKIGETVTATAKAYAGYKFNETESIASGKVVAPTVADGATDISGVTMLTLIMRYDIADVSVDLNEIAVKYLVQKDSLPIKYKETFTVNVYEYNTGYGYRGYRPGRYVATLSATFERMKPMEKPGTLKPGFGFVSGLRYGCIIGTPVLSEFANIYKQTLSSNMSFVKGSGDGADGILTFDKPGTYYYKLVETDNRTPYMEYVSAAYLKIVVTQGEKGLVATYTPVKITNVYDKNGNVNSADNSSVTLTKVDSVDKTKVLQGAKFRLYQEGKYGDYEYFKTYTTDYNGEIEIFNLAAGDYYFVEVAAPTGYELDDSKIEFTIGKTTKTNDVELTVTNKKINIFTEDHFAYIQGYEDGTVRPQNNITRAEAATILFRLLDDGVRSKYWDTASSYADVSPAAWYNNAVATLENMGVLEVGVNYRPNDYITRAELAFMITNFYDMAALDIEGIALTDITGHVYETAIKQAAAMGWVKGYTDGSFNPDANITRAEAMTLINRVLGRAVEQRGMAAGMKTWPDNPVGAWYYEDVQEATNSHTYTRTTTLVSGYDFYYESWGFIQANTDWTALETTWATGK